MDIEGPNKWGRLPSNFHNVDPFSGELPHIVPMWPREWYEAQATSAAGQLREVPWTCQFWNRSYPDEKKLSDPELLKWRVEITRLYRPTGQGKQCPADKYFPSSAVDAMEEYAFFHCLMELTSHEPGAFIGAKLGSEVARLGEEAARKKRWPGICSRLIKACKLRRAQRPASSALPRLRDRTAAVTRHCKAMHSQQPSAVS